MNTIVRHRFAKPLRARYVRIVPVLWHGHISIRVELYGGRLGEWNNFCLNDHTVDFNLQTQKLEPPCTA